MGSVLPNPISGTKPNHLSVQTKQKKKEQTKLIKKLEPNRTKIVWFGFSVTVRIFGYGSVLLILGTEDL